MLNHSIIVLALGVVFCVEAEGREGSFQCPEEIPGSQEEARALAGRFFAKAERAFLEQRYNRALRLFVSSLCVLYHPNTIHNIDETTEIARNKKRALNTLKAYVTSREDSGSTLEIKKIIHRVEGDLGLEPTVDESEISGASEFGEEKLGYDAETDPQTVKPASDVGDSAAIEPPDKEVVLGLTRRGIYSYLFIGTGTGVLIAGAFLQVISYAAKLEAEQADERSVFDKESNRRRKLQIGATVCFVVGGAITLTGIVLLAVDRKRNKKPRKKLSLIPTGNGLLLSGKF